MAQASYPHSNSPMGEPEWRKAARLFVGTGVDDQVAGLLEPSADGTVLETQVAAGRAYVDGFLFELDAATSVAHAAADPTNDRIDVVVVRYDPDGSGTAGQGSARLEVVTGTPVAAPVAPAITEDPTGIFDLEVARVTVRAASAVVALSDVDDRRTFVGSVRDKAGTTAERGAYVAEAGTYWWSTDDLTLTRWSGTGWQSIFAPLRTEYLELAAQSNLRLWQLEADVIAETEGFTGWQGEAFLTGQNEVESVVGDIDVARAARLGGGGVTISASPIIGLSPGDAFMGGFFAGVVDTTQANIIAGDQYQTGLRYALIISPASLEPAPGQRWYLPGGYVGNEAKTRWNGLAAQQALLPNADFEAFGYCAGLSFPTDDGSGWYLPALDELELLYRNLKPTTASNSTAARTGHDFPGGTQNEGTNPSSDPQGAPYTTGDPAQTTVTVFQGGGAEAFIDPAAYYWAATWYSSTSAWLQVPGTGFQTNGGQTLTNRRVRPVRRLVL